MAQKRMTDSELISARQEEEERRTAKSLFEPDHSLDKNTCWMYQLEIETRLKQLMPDQRIHGRFIAMLGMLATQARKWSSE